MSPPHPIQQAALLSLIPRRTLNPLTLFQLWHVYPGASHHPPSLDCSSYSLLISTLVLLPSTFLTPSGLSFRNMNYIMRRLLFNSFLVASIAFRKLTSLSPFLFFFLILCPCFHDPASHASFHMTLALIYRVPVMRSSTLATRRAHSHFRAFAPAIHPGLAWLTLAIQPLAPVSPSQTSPPSMTPLYFNSSHNTAHSLTWFLFLYFLPFLCSITLHLESKLHVCKGFVLLTAASSAARTVPGPQ